MHISEGILPAKWAGFWFLISLPFLLRGIFTIKRKVRARPEFKPLLGLIGAVVFVISCMPVPIPFAGTCSHPCGTAISAMLIGPIMSIFVAAIALLLQALFLAHGGITTWGADIVSMGIVGSFAGYFAFKIFQKFRAPLFICGFAAGLMADWATYLMTSFELALALHGSKPILALFGTIAVAFVPTQLPLGILEGFLTGGMVLFVARRRPDILVSLGVIKQSKEPIRRSNAKRSNRVKIIFVLLTSLSLFAAGHAAFADNKTKWVGVDETVVEKVAEEHGRSAWTSFINTDQGDLLLFIFLLAGTVGGFLMGYNFRKLFKEKDFKT